MRGMKRFVGRTVMVSTVDNGAIRGTLWRVERGGVELRDATEAVRNVSLAGIIWVPAQMVAQIQVAGGDS